MAVRRMVGDDVDHHLDVGRMQRGHHLVELVQGADLRVDVPVVVDVVAAVGQRGGVERAQPHGVDAQVPQIVHPRRDAGQISDPVGVGVGETAGIDLVDDGLAPPAGEIENFATSLVHG